MEQESKLQADNIIDNNQNSNLILRVISALVLIPTAIYFVYQGGVLFNSLITSIAVLMGFEWKKIISSDGVLIDESSIRKWEILGFLYILTPCISLIWLRNISYDEYGIDGLDAILWVFALVWSVDIAAYFTGKKFGGKKLAPKISPNKTWAGFFGGIGAAIVVAIAISIIINTGHLFIFILINILLSLVAQGGDLFESWIKRKFGIKDSGNLIPGHGGVLDRVDALITTAPVAVLIIILTSGEGIFK